MNPMLFAADVGQGETPLVLLHGFGSWHGTWAGIVSRLGGRVIAYDLPGHAASLGFPGAGSAKLAASAILADLAASGFGTVHLAGHSMGGAIAVLMALEEPDRVRSLSLLAPGGFGTEIDAPLLGRYAAALSAEELAACLAEMSGPGARVDQGAVARLQAVRAIPGQREKLIGIAAAITRDGRQGVIGRPLLENLASPVHVLWGTRDPVVPFAQARNMPERFVLHPVRGAGHMLIDEAPDLVLGMISNGPE